MDTEDKGVGSNTEAAHETVRFFRNRVAPELFAEFTGFMEARAAQLLSPREGRGRTKTREGYVRLLKIAREGFAPPPRVAEQTPEEVAPVQPEIAYFSGLAPDPHSTKIDQAQRAERRLRLYAMKRNQERETIRDVAKLTSHSYSFERWVDEELPGDNIALVNTWSLMIDGSYQQWRCKVDGVVPSTKHPAGFKFYGQSTAFVESIGGERPVPNGPMFYTWAINLQEGTLISWDLHDGKRNTVFRFTVWRNGALHEISEGTYKVIAYERKINLR